MTAFAFNVIKYFICFLSPREKKINKIEISGYKNIVCMVSLICKDQV